MGILDYLENGPKFFNEKIELALAELSGKAAFVLEKDSPVNEEPVSEQGSVNMDASENEPPHKQTESSIIRLTSEVGKSFETRIDFKVDRGTYKSIGSKYQYLQTAPGSYQFELVKDENSETGWSLQTAPHTDLNTLLNDSVCEVNLLYPLYSGDIIKIGSKVSGVTAAPLTVSFLEKEFCSNASKEPMKEKELKKTEEEPVKTEDEPVKTEEEPVKTEDPGEETAGADEVSAAEAVTVPITNQDEDISAEDTAEPLFQVNETENKEEPAAKEPAKPWNCSSEEIMPKSAILARAKQSEKNVKEWIATYGDKVDQLEFAFNFALGGSRVHVVYDSAGIPEELWFIGDLHGDILALDSALSYIDSHSISPTIVFLGDLFDRFDYGLEVVMRVIDLIIRRPGKILWIAGNHDDGLQYKDGKFIAGYNPAEFADFLNGHKEYEEFGEWLVKFMQKLPAVLFLPDGLFVAHGACLGWDVESFSGNLIQKVASLQELERPEYLNYFIRYRIGGMHGDTISPLDLPDFMAGMESLIGYPVKRMLRGHDHCKETRHEFSSEAPYLTICSMSTWYLGALSDPGDDELPRKLRKNDITTPAIAKFRFNELPEVITLDIPRSVVEQFHIVEDLKTEKS